MIIEALGSIQTAFEIMSEVGRTATVATLVYGARMGFSRSGMVRRLHNTQAV